MLFHLYKDLDSVMFAAIEVSFPFISQEFVAFQLYLFATNSDSYG